MNITPAVTPLQKLQSEILDRAEVTLWVKRLDLIHPVVSGNKWYKLKYNLLAAQAQGATTVLSFGGAYSNHIHALAGACKMLGLSSIGVIRGEPHTPLNATLRYAQSCGMRLHYLNRSDYRLKHTDAIQQPLKDEYGELYIVPEGGSNALALKGVAELIPELGDDYDRLCCACGSGGTLAGLICGLHGHKQLEGFAALKGASFLYADVRRLLSEAGLADQNNWQINLDYHFGGFAKTTAELLAFIHKFETEQGIPLEPLYTGKLFYGLFERIKAQAYPRGTRIIALHSGGLQGVDRQWQ
ncbi:MAG: pyridoxal-phosphate dependent enzyme [Gammaproteobacteria bacterium]|nr:pyridoxal-phosphate dependent enzyme [Gammaproteobacteria bacterium]